MSNSSKNIWFIDLNTRVWVQRRCCSLLKYIRDCDVVCSHGGPTHRWATSKEAGKGLPLIFALARILKQGFYYPRRTVITGVLVYKGRSSYVVAIHWVAVHRRVKGFIKGEGGDDNIFRSLWKKSVHHRGCLVVGVQISSCNSKYFLSFTHLHTHTHTQTHTLTLLIITCITD